MTSNARRKASDVSYLQRLGLRRANYDLKPYVAVPGFDDHCWEGWARSESG